MFSFRELDAGVGAGLKLVFTPLPLSEDDVASLARRVVRRLTKGAYRYLAEHDEQTDAPALPLELLNYGGRPLHPHALLCLTLPMMIRILGQIGNSQTGTLYRLGSGDLGDFSIKILGLLSASLS